MVVAQSLGDADRQALRRKKGNCRAGAPVGRHHASHLGRWRNARQISARSVQTGNQARFNNINTTVKNDRNAVDVIALAARAGGVPPIVAITATERLIRSPANSGSRSFLNSAQRYSMATFRPS